MKNIPLHEVRQICNLKDMLSSSVDLYGDKPAFLVKHKGNENYKPVSYRQFERDVEAFGTALLGIGLKGERIAIIGENRYEWAVSYLSVVNGVGVVVPLDKELPQNEIESLLLRSRAKALIFSSNKREEILSLSQKVPSINYLIDMNLPEDQDNIFSFSKLVSKGLEMMSNGNLDFRAIEIDEKALVSLLFTSGTTGQSKAAMLSHENICTNLMAMCSMLYIGEKDTFLSVLPIHHTYECTCGFLCPIYRGCTIAYCEGLRHIVKNLKEAKATIMLGVPLIFETIYRKLWEQVSKTPGLEKKLRSGVKISSFLQKIGIDVRKKLFSKLHENFGGKIRLFISGAAAIDPLVAKGFRDLGIHFVQGYGLTECSPIVALNRGMYFKDDAAGLPLPNLEVKIDSPNNEGVGEIIVKGPSVMLGYYEDPTANEKVFKDGWYHTGDLAYKDSDGFFHITGRKKNVIVTKNGKNIYPEEIEAMLGRNPYIKESLVYGKDDEASGDVVVSAIIVPDKEAIEEDFKDKQMSGKDIYELVREQIKAINKHLVNYKHIKHFKLREDEFAKTTTKKIKRYLEEV